MHERSKTYLHLTCHHPVSQHIWCQASNGNVGIDDINIIELQSGRPGVLLESRGGTWVWYQLRGHSVAVWRHFNNAADGNHPQHLS
ncbi:uncharacterized protein BCR38DRAFT_427189 [Pseudomassariella vexata]|uniref:Uncharacterized protein n=1 Tax=Pseudomassariella vexata TaxID=1141098 RepID=A0A1Y2E873_9PEZI|nr:uncharacterized protein BCR38DRAFT_427189 [Pseudomassariella vexata]ORY67486.1 hypothetical protein BCR38DRAFT_427189 [Pseudomassariella vexata]